MWVIFFVEHNVEDVGLGLERTGLGPGGPHDESF